MDEHQGPPFGRAKAKVVLMISQAFAGVAGSWPAVGDSTFRSSKHLLEWVALWSRWSRGSIQRHLRRCVLRPIGASVAQHPHSERTDHPLGMLLGSRINVVHYECLAQPCQDFGCCDGVAGDEALFVKPSSWARTPRECGRFPRGDRSSIGTLLAASRSAFYECLEAATS